MIGRHQLTWLLTRRILLRHWKKAWRSTLALTLTLALGVGVFFAIRLANRAAVSGFQLFTDSVTGGSDLIISSPAGWLDEQVLARLRDAAGDTPATFFPVLETTATLPGSGRGEDGFFARQLQVVGVDLPSLANLVYLTSEAYEPLRRSDVGEIDPFAEGFGQAAPAYAPAALARTQGWSVGDEIALGWNTTIVPIKLAGLLPEGNFRLAPPENLLLMDLPDVQRLTAQPGRVQRVEARLPPGPFREVWLAELRGRLEAAADGRWTLAEPEALRRSGDLMTRAFRLNLTILSALALLVGVYLIVQALEAAVVRRRQEIGILRSLGVEPGAIQRTWLAEALLLGLVGSGVGLGLGFLGAQLAVRAIARTINSLYYSNTVEAAGWHWGEAALACAVGLATSLVAGWWPARDAAATPPAEVLQRGYRGGGLRWLRRPAWGGALILAGLLASRLPPLSLTGHVQFPLAGYLAAVFWVVGGGIVASGWFGLVPRLGPALARNHPEWRLASSQLRRPTGRHRLAVASLVTAFSMAAGMSLLIASFQTTMQRWINRVLRADVYIAPQGVGNISSANRIEPEVWQAIQRDPRIASTEVGQMFPIEIDGAATHLVGAQHDQQGGWRELLWLRAPASPDLPATPADDAWPAWANESFVNRFGVDLGETVRVPTPAGPRSLRITGVFADYGNERGALVIHRQLLARWFSDDRAFNLTAYLAPGVDPARVQDDLRARHSGLVVRLNGQLRAEVLRVFHQTFAVTYALKWIGILVAVVGLGLTLASLVIERRREFATLQELGMPRAQVARTVAFEGLLVAAVGVLAGAALSVALGWLLIFVINRQSFGWTLAFQIPWLDIAGTAAGVLGVAWLVAWRVGYWAAEQPSDREE